MQRAFMHNRLWLCAEWWEVAFQSRKGFGQQKPNRKVFRLERVKDDIRGGEGRLRFHFPTIYNFLSMDTETIRFIAGAVVLIAFLATKMTNQKTNDKNN